MKCFIIFMSLVIVVHSIDDKELWLQFKKYNGRSFSDMEEERRFSIFQQNLRKIEAHNADYSSKKISYYLEVNQMADISEEEFRLKLNTKMELAANSEFAYKYVPSNLTLPNEINWVAHGAVTPVEDQGSCASSWAFSATGTLEGQYAIQRENLVPLSEQNLIDCSVPYGNVGCRGGNVQAAYDYVRENGIEKQSDYQYLNYQAQCSQDPSLNTVRVDGYVFLPNSDEFALQDALATVGPIAVSINADQLQFYAGGIFDNSSCSNDVNHSVLVVGYGEENGAPYWLVKNSWGTYWGESGYLRISRNKNNLCGIASYATYPITG